MDNEICEDSRNHEEDLSEVSLTAVNELSCTCNIAVINTKVEDIGPALTDLDGVEAFLVLPITPEFNRESRECQHDDTSLITFVPTPPEAIYDHLYLNNGPSSMENGENLHTQKKVSFDPFAPGAGKFMLGPHCRRYKQESRTSVAQLLKFKSLVSSIEVDDQGAYSGIITNDKILLEIGPSWKLSFQCRLQMRVFLPNSSVCLLNVLTMDSGALYVQTRLSGVGETCPGAPVKATTKFRNIDMGLCRKLEL